MADLLTVVVNALKVGAKPVTDQVHTASPLSARIIERGPSEVANGLMVTEDIAIGENPTVGWRPSKAGVPLTESDPLASVGWGDATLDGAVVVYQSDIDKVKNGSADAKSLAKTLIQNCIRTMRKKWAISMYGNGTADDGAAMLIGLEGVVDTDNTYGIIVDENGNFVTALDRTNADYSWWRPNVGSTVEDIAIDAGDDGGIRGLMIKCMVGDEETVPDLAPTTPELWQKIVSQIPIGDRHMDPKLAQLGYRNVMLDEMAIVLDRYCPGPTSLSTVQAKSNLYVLTTQHFNLRPRASCAKGIRTTTQESLVPIGKDAVAQLVVWTGQLTCRSPRNQGKLINKS